MTRVHAADGSLIAEYARERRLYLPIQAMPEAGDRGFPLGRGQEFLQASRHRSRGHRARRRGQSPLQRPARAGRLDHHAAGRQELPRSATSGRYERKIREALLALRIEATYSKDKILELYLNEIYPRPRGEPTASPPRRSNYFGKSVHELTHRRGRLSRGAAEGARTTTIRSASAGRASSAATRSSTAWSRTATSRSEDGEKAKKEPLDVNPRVAVAEHHRRRLFRRGSAPRNRRALRREEALRGRPLGPHHARSEDAGDGPQGAASTGSCATTRRTAGAAPSARSTCRPRLGPGAGRSAGARRRAALAARRRARRRRRDRPASACSRRATRPARSVASARPASITADGVKWTRRPVRRALSRRRRGLCRADGRQAGPVPPAPDPGDFRAPSSPWTPIRAASSPWSAASPSTRASSTARRRRMRQPGSSFKPFVYATALDNGYTPSSIDPGRADRDRPGPGAGSLAAGELRRQVRRPAHAALRHRAFQEPDDGAPRQDVGMPLDRRICHALRRL